MSPIDDVSEYEHPPLDSGDQMPSQPNLWGDRYGRQQLCSNPPKDRWWHALRCYLRARLGGGGERSSDIAGPYGVRARH